MLFESVLSLSVICASVAYDIKYICNCARIACTIAMVLINELSKLTNYYYCFLLLRQLEP